MSAAPYTPETEYEPLPWYALRVRSNFERTSSDALQMRGLDTFLPTVKLRRRWSDRVKVIDQPLFPGYVFCRFDSEDRINVVRAPGVVHVVGAGNEPQPVDPTEIEYVRTVVLAELAAKPHPFLNAGQNVRIDRGPLAGAQGIITAANGTTSLILSISLLQRSIAVEVNADWVRPN